MKKKNYKYLLGLCAKVDEFLASPPLDYDGLAEIVIAFCTIFEKLTKMELYKKNPILVYDYSKIKENNVVFQVVRRKHLNWETINAKEAVCRFNFLHPKKAFSDDEVQVLFDVYNVRNHFVHDHGSDESFLGDQENLVKMMGTVWEKILNIAVRHFGRFTIKANKPEKKYSKEELESILIEEVRKKIQRQSSAGPYLAFDAFGQITPYRALSASADFTYSSGGDRCPRCGSLALKNNDSDSDRHFLTTFMYYPNHSTFPLDLYRCSSCQLELTKKEYEIAKRIHLSTE